MGPKVKAFLILAVMFGLGAASGIVWQNYRASQMPAHHTYVAHRMQKLAKQLRLSLEQEQALRQIFDRAHERASQINEEVSWDLDDIHHDTVQEIHQVLTPEQLREFDRIHQSHHRRGASSGTAQTPASSTSEKEDAGTNS